MVLVAALGVSFCASVLLQGGQSAQYHAAASERSSDHSSAFPSRSIKIMAPASPGGGWDQLARLMQRSLVSDHISPVSVEVINRGGAGGTIGLTELVTQHRRDPYMWMVGGSTLVSAMLMHNTRFDLTQAELLARLASEYDVIAVPIDSPFQDMGDLIEAFEKEPESFVWGGGSAGSADHLLVGMIVRELGVDPSSINYVAYPGGGEAAAAVMGGQVNAGVAGYAEWKDLEEAKKLRLLAVSAPQRMEGVNIPTLIDSGIDVHLENWRFVVAGKGLSPAERTAIENMLREMRGTDRWQRVLETYSWEDRFLTGPELDSFVAAEIRATARLLEDLGLSSSGQASKIGPYLFPNVIAVLLVVTGLALLIRMLASRNRLAGIAGAGETNPSNVEWRGFLLSAGLVLVYLIALDFVGFLISTPIYMTLQSRIMGSEKIVRNQIIFLLFTLLVFLAFEKLLSISLP